MQVLVRDNNVDQALRVLKKKMQREGIFREMKQRKAYEKPSVRKAREKAEAVRRARKQARKTAIREGLIAAPKPKPRFPAGGRRPGFPSPTADAGRQGGNASGQAPVTPGARRLSDPEPVSKEPGPRERPGFFFGACRATAGPAVAATDPGPSGKHNDVTGH